MGDDKDVLVTTDTEGDVAPCNYQRCVCMSWMALTLTHALGLMIAATMWFPMGKN